MKTFMNTICLILLALIAGYFGGVSVTAMTTAQDDSIAFVPEVIRTHRLEIVDDAGITRGIYSVLSEGSPSITLFDSQGNHRMVLSLSDHNFSGILFFDDNGKVRASFRLSNDGSPEISFWDSDRKLFWSAS